MTTARLCVAKEFHQDPWDDGGIGGWTWPQIWLAYRHEQDLCHMIKKSSDQAKKNKKGTMKLGDWLSAQGVFKDRG